MADDYAASTATTGVVSVGGSATGNIEATQDKDWFGVTLTAGRSYQFDLEGTATGQGTLPDPFLRLRDGAGDSISFDFDGGTGNNGRITFAPSVSGTYFLSASDELSGLGTYKLSAVDLGPGGDDYAASTATTGVVSVGGSATGNIEATQDKDWFGVTLTAGRSYQFDLEGTATGQGTLPDPFLRLRDGAGDSISFDFDGGTGNNGRITFAPSVSGTYFLSASDELSGLGTYKLSAVDLGPGGDDYAASTATTGVVSVGGSATGNIEATQDKDWFGVTLTAGRSYQFDLEGTATGQGTLPDPFLRLRDGAGDSISFDFDGGTGNNGRITFAPSVSGTYFLSASDELSGLGTYKLSAVDLGVNQRPVITSNGGGDTAALSVLENSTAVTTVAATDKDGGALTYTIKAGGDGALFKLDPTTHALSFKTAPDFEAPADAGKNNVYDVTVQVSDGTNVDTQLLHVSVTNVAGVTIVGSKKNDKIDAIHTPTGQPFPTNEEDTISGGNKNDKIFGLAGNDKLSGGKSKFKKDKPKGANKLTGGDGADSFKFDTKLKKSKTKVMDFDSAEGDKVLLAKSLFDHNRMKDGDISAQDFQRLFDYTKNGTLKYEGHKVAKFVGAPDLHADDFMLV